MITYHTHRTINTGNAQFCAHDIKRDHYALIAAEMPKPNTHVAQDKLATCWGTICMWLRLAYVANVPMILLGPKGPYWCHDYVDIQLRDGVLHRSDHEACTLNANVTNDTQNPSAYCFT